MRDRWYQLLASSLRQQETEVTGSGNSILLSGYGNRKIQHMEWSALSGGLSGSNQLSPDAVSIAEPHPLKRGETSIKLTVADTNGNTTVSYIHLQNDENLGSSPYGLYTDPTGTYKDVLTYDRGAEHPLKIIRRCKVLILNGMESGWVTPSTDQTRHVLYLSDCKKAGSNSDPVTVACTHFRNSTYNNVVTNKNIDRISNSTSGSASGGIMIRLASNDVYSGAEGFRSFLGGKADQDIPVTVVYPLVNEVTEYITPSAETLALLSALDSSDKTLQIADNASGTRAKYIYCSKYSVGFYITSGISDFKIKF